MIPLSGNDSFHHGDPFKDKSAANKANYSANATSIYGPGNNDELVASKSGGIGYEREFTIEEQYLEQFPMSGPPRIDEE